MPNLPGRCRRRECFIDRQTACDGVHYCIDDPVELAYAARVLRLGMARRAAREERERMERERTAMAPESAPGARVGAAGTPVSVEAVGAL